MFKCQLCERTRFGKKHHLRYKALNEDGEPETYTMNICIKCAGVIEKNGQKHDKDENVIPEKTEFDGD
jgi:hypothetical protein